MASNNIHDDVRCVFCNQEFNSKNEFKDHLMICGNKTDQCPKCRKYIRRAIFAYHYENDCADLDEADGPRQAPRKEEPVQETTTECPFCQREFEFTEIEQHVISCEKDSERNTGRSLPVTYNEGDHFDNASTGHQPILSYNTTTTRATMQPESERAKFVICPRCKIEVDSNFYWNYHRDLCMSRISYQRATQRASSSLLWNCRNCGSVWLKYQYWLDHIRVCPKRQ